MAKLSSIAEFTPQKILIYGEPKTGKTLVTGKLAKYFKLDWFDLEAGVSTLFQLDKELQDNIEVISIKDTKMNPQAVLTMDSLFRGIKLKICDVHGTHNCKTCTEGFVNIDLKDIGPDHVVVIDSLTQLSDSAIAYATRNLEDGAKIEYSHWAAQGFYLSRILSAIQQAPFNIVVITHADIIKGADDVERLRPICGTREFSQKVAKYFDHVVYMESKNLKHVAASSTSYKNNILTGSRAGIALEKYAAPDLACLLFAKHPNPPPDIKLLLDQQQVVAVVKEEVPAEKKKFVLPSKKTS